MALFAGAFVRAAAFHSGSNMVSLHSMRISLRFVSLTVLLAAAFFAGGSAHAQTAGIDGVTQAQPAVSPGEFRGDLSKLPFTAASKTPQAKVYRQRLQGPSQTKFQTTASSAPSAPGGGGGPRPPMPPTIQNFAGLNFNDVCTGGQCGSGWPPDPNGDVGPNHYVQAVNTAIAIYDKTGNLLASFTEDNLWSGVGATPCNGNSQGDPIVVYDWLADRFVITWFAFGVDVNFNPVSPFYQCIAASKTNDPVVGGWWLYAIRTDPGTSGTPAVGDLNDYPKFGAWHDCLYMGANLFRFDALNNGTYDGVMFASFSRANLYSGAPLTYSLGVIGKKKNAFTLVPSNNQGTGANAVQPGTPNYIVSESGKAFAFEVRKFTAGANCGAGGTLSSPVNVTQAAYTFEQGAIVPQPGTAHTLDMIDDRVMQKVPYRKIGGAESLWVTHPVGTGVGNMVAMQWVQINVTGGVIATSPVQQQIYAPDATLYRFMGSLAVDRLGNMALGYSTSNGTAPNYPSLAYSGRLVTDPLNTLPQTETQLIAGSGSQNNNCGGAACDRWGDYSAMSLDPADSCTFWYVNEYYSSQANGNVGNWQTRIGSFKFPSCSSLPPTTTTLSGAPPSPSTVGQLVTFTATVTGSSPTGSINFTSDGSSISGCAAVILAAGSAQCPTSALPQGTHSIVANYGGDAGNAPSQSATYTQVVNSGGGGSVDVALAANGGVASASSTFSASYPPSAVNNGDRAGLNYGAGGVWKDGTAGVYPDWIQVNFSGPQTINQIIVYSMQDNYTTPVDPSNTMTFTRFGLTAFDVQTWNGSAWVTQGSVSGNNLVKRTVSFSAVSTDRIRVLINASANLKYSFMTEVEAWTP
jgi:hypothetical protein